MTSATTPPRTLEWTCSLYSKCACFQLILRDGCSQLTRRLAPTIMASSSLSFDPLDRGKRAKDEIEKQGLGYIIITGDPLIGARKQFLDPVEMAIFNSNISKVLAITGVYRIVHQEIDKAIYAIENELKPDLPKLIVSYGL